MPIMQVKDGQDDIRVDLGSKVPVKFLNNLEKDRMYQGWHSSLQVRPCHEVCCDTWCHMPSCGRLLPSQDTMY